MLSPIHDEQMEPKAWSTHRRCLLGWARHTRGHCAAAHPRPGARSLQDCIPDVVGPLQGAHNDPPAPPATIWHEGRGRASSGLCNACSPMPRADVRRPVLVRVDDSTLERQEGPADLIAGPAAAQVPKRHTELPPTFACSSILLGAPLSVCSSTPPGAVRYTHFHLLARL